VPGALAVFAVFLRLGLTCFGGPVAHLGFFRQEFVARRAWLDERQYADLVALCQFLPGPASSQTGLAIGLMRAGLPGAFAAWLGFTLPSALIMAGFAFAVSGAVAGGWLVGLKLAAVAVVAWALWGMARTLAPDAERATVAVAAAAAMSIWPVAWVQLAVLALAAAVGRIRFTPDELSAGSAFAVPVRRRLALACLVVFFALLAGLALLAAASDDPLLASADAFYRAGSLVFGGGHVVLPLLQAEVVGPGWVDRDTFLAGYGAAQALPGPLFAISAHLGAAMQGWAGAAVALVAIFAPSFLLVIGVLPFWDRLRARPGARGALVGVNAAVVGLLLAALYDPVWTAAVTGPDRFAFGLAAFLMLALWKVPPWAVVLLAAGGGELLLG